MGAGRGVMTTHQPLSPVCCFCGTITSPLRAPSASAPYAPYAAALRLSLWLLLVGGRPVGRLSCTIALPNWRRPPWRRGGRRRAGLPMRRRSRRRFLTLRRLW